MPPGATVVTVELKGEFMDLLGPGDARFRTIRMRCLSYEELRRLGFTSIPWKESDVRTLLNTLRDREVSPHKLQQVWDALKWFSKKFGLLARDGDGTFQGLCRSSGRNCCQASLGIGV